MRSDPDLLRDRKLDGVRHHRAFEAREFVLWASREGFCRNAEQGHQLGTALIKANLIRRIDWAPVFVYPEAGSSCLLYQLRTRPSGDDRDQETDSAILDQWDYEWGNDRPGRRQQGGHNGLTDPVFKLRFQSLCLQWTQESREAMTDWLAQLNLATQPEMPKVQKQDLPALSSSPQTRPAGSVVQAASESHDVAGHEESLVEYLKRTANGEVMGEIGKQQDPVEKVADSGQFHIAWIIEVNYRSISYSSALIHLLIHFAKQLHKLSLLCFGDSLFHSAS
jgi:hypothetical protein